MTYLTHKIDNPEFIKFIEEKYNIRECDQKKLRNTFMIKLLDFNFVLY